jgi:hypothetical protein
MAMTNRKTPTTHSTMQRHKQPFTFLLLTAISLNLGSEAQANPTLTKDRLKNGGSLPVVTAWPYTKREITTNAGSVTLRWLTTPPSGLMPWTSTITSSDKALCLTKEEISGAKVEREIRIIRPELYTKLIPGGVISSKDLLAQDRLTYLGWSQRKPYSIAVFSQHAKRSSSTVGGSPGSPLQPLTGSEITENKALAASNQLISASNYDRPTTIRSDSYSEQSESAESLAFKISASGAFGGFNASYAYQQAESRFRSLFMFNFEERVLSVNLAQEVASPQDLFTSTSGLSNDEPLLISNVTYGRGLSIKVESERNLREIQSELDAGFKALGFNGSLSKDLREKIFNKYTRISASTLGGKPVMITNEADLKRVIRDFQSAQFPADGSLVPLYYEVRDLNGRPLSLLATAALSPENCLDAKGLRITLSSIRLVNANDGDVGSVNDEEFYGGIQIRMFNSQGKQVLADGKTLAPKASGNLPVPPTRYIAVGTEEAPRVIAENTAQELNRSVDIPISNLDARLEIVPAIKEQDTVSDDEFKIQGGAGDKFNMTLRKMLISGERSRTFRMVDGGSLLEINVEIDPIAIPVK